MLTVNTRVKKNSHLQKQVMIIDMFQKSTNRENSFRSTRLFDNNKNAAHNQNQTTFTKVNGPKQPV